MVSMVGFHIYVLYSHPRFSYRELSKLSVYPIGIWGIILKQTIITYFSFTITHKHEASE